MASNFDNIKALIEAAGTVKAIQGATLAESYLFRSGLATLDPELERGLRGTGGTFRVTFADLDDTVEYGTTDNALDDRAHQRLKAVRQIGVSRVAAITPLDITDMESVLADEDLVGAGVELMKAARVRRIKKDFGNLMVALAGVDTDTGTAGTQAGLTQSITGSLTYAKFVDAVVAQWGEYGTIGGNVLVGNASLFAQLRKDQNAGGGIVTPNTVNADFSDWVGNTLVADDSMPAGKIAVFRKGAVKAGFGSPLIREIELQRVPQADNAVGMTSIYGRMAYALHIDGFSFINAAALSDRNFFVTGTTAETAANWSLVAPVKRVPFFMLNVA